jgi:hypothetical protein
MNGVFSPITGGVVGTERMLSLFFGYVLLIGLGASGIANPNTDGPPLAASHYLGLRRRRLDGPRRLVGL